MKNSEVCGWGALALRLFLVIALSVLHAFVSIFTIENAFNPTTYILLFTESCDSDMLALVFQSVMHNLVTLLASYVFLLKKDERILVRKTWIFPLCVSVMYRILIQEANDSSLLEYINSSLIGNYFETITGYSSSFSCFLILLGITLISLAYIIAIIYYNKTYKSENI